MKTLQRMLVMLLWCLTLFASHARADTITYFHNDLLGSPAAATNESGTVIWREAYSGYGERIKNEANSAPNKVWYTSRHQDADTGLVYMGARYYDPALGRFLSVDSMGFSEGNVHSFNRYAYGNNNPYRFKDPDGRLAIPAVVTGLFIVAGGVYVANCEGCKQSVRQTWDTIRGLGNRLFSESADGDGKTGEDSGDKTGSAGGTRAGKPFTPKGKAEIDAENAAQNGGVNVCVDCGEEVVPGKKSERGVRPPGNQRERDHIIPQSKGGDGSTSNGQILCRDCNNIKSDN